MGIQNLITNQSANIVEVLFPCYVLLKYYVTYDLTVFKGYTMKMRLKTSRG